MSAIERRSQLFAIAAAFALGCASTPEVVERTREDFRAAQADPSVARGAKIELEQARTAIERLEDAADDDASEDELDHLAYIAEQKIQIARVAASEEEIRDQVEELSEKREALKLCSRDRAKPVEIEIKSETVR